MLRNVLKILLSALILIAIAALLFELGNYIVQKLIIIDSSNSYLFRNSFLETILLITVITGIPYFLFIIFTSAMKINKMVVRVISALGIQLLFLLLFSFEGTSSIFTDIYVLKNIFVLLLVSAMMPFIDQKVRHI